MSESAPLLETPLAAVAGLDVNEALTDFVRQELRRFRLATLEDGKAVSVAVLAGRIQALDDDLDFSPETLRRFLNAERQKTSADLIRAIAGYLLEEEWITTGDLEALGANTDHRAAFAMSSFYGIRDNEKTNEFYHSLIGAYRNYRIDTDRLIQTDCGILISEQGSALSITEVVRAYDILPGTSLETSALKKRAIDVASYPALEKTIAEEAEAVGAPLRASGFGLADHRLIYFCLTDARTGLPRLYDVFALGFNQEDVVSALRAHGSIGWRASSLDDARGPLAEFSTESPRLAEADRIFLRLRLAEGEGP